MKLGETLNYNNIINIALNILTFPKNCQNYQKHTLLIKIQPRKKTLDRFENVNARLQIAYLL